MNIVIPMAGLGSRFKNAGYVKPKPLIPVLDRPMYAWAVDSLPLDRASQLIFILLSSQPEFPLLKQDIKDRFAKYSPLILDIPELTAGQAVTVLCAKDYIDSDTPLLIHNSDTAFDVDPDWCQSVLKEGADGALLVFPSQEQRWSYSKEDKDGWVVEVREKQVISQWASTGTYWFRRGSDYVRLAECRISSMGKESGEYYVGPLYNDLIAEGGKVQNFRIEQLYCFGTPEDMEYSLSVLKNKLLRTT